MSPTEHAAAVAERWAELPAQLEAKIAALGEGSRAAEERLVSQAFKSKTTTQRITWLRRAIDTAARAAEPHVACRAGCDSCCHLAVEVSLAEAERIAKLTGRSLNRQAHSFTVDTVTPEFHKAMVDKAYGTPCPFLAAGRCSIYDERPIACRQLLNLDRDDLLCQIVREGEPPQVPKLDMTQYNAMAILLQGEQQRYADLREWFPAPVTPPAAAD